MTADTPPFDMLLSAELLVDDASATLDLLVDRLGIERPRDSWRQLWPGWGFEAYWCRVGADLTASPTRLEIISPHGTPDPSLAHPHMHDIFAAQGDRPSRAHSTPIAVPDVAALARRLTTRGARFRLDPLTDELPFLRLWMGFRNDEPTSYLADSDAGLRLEFVPTSALGLPPGASEPSAAGDLGPPDGRFVGVTARIFTTDDLDATIATVRATFDWSPSIVTEPDGGRRAIYRFSFERSGVLEVVEPAPGSPEHAHLSRWGGGPFGIRLAVNGIDAKAADLGDRATPFDVIDRGGNRLLLVDPAATTGTHFEIGDCNQPSILD